MKKIMVVMVGMMLLAAPAFAANDVTSAGSLLIGGGALTAPAVGNSAQLTIGLSPKVVARYVTDGTNEITSQWYAIAAVHPGGSVGYATAQDVNNIYMQAFNTGDDTATITDDIQTEKTPAAAAEGATEEEIAAALAATWSGAGWTTTTPQ